MSDMQSFIAAQTPPGWQTRPLWALFRRRKRTGYADEELLSVYRDHGVIPKSSRDDNHNKESDDLSGYQLVTLGALVTNKMKAWQGSIAISRFKGIVSPAYYVYEPLSDECDQFLHYLLRSDPYIALYGRISKGVRVNQWDLEHEALRNVPVMLPDPQTQKSIANFLDRETARIDSLIAKKQRLLVVINEREDAALRSLLSGAETDAVNWKSTDTPWLSSVPKHWEIVPLRYLVRITTGGRDTQDRTDDGQYPFYVRSMTVERIDTYSHDEEAVLTSGDGAGVGKVFHHVTGKFELHQRMYAFTDFTKLTGRYFFHFLRTFFHLQMTQWSAKSTVDSVRMPFLKSMLFAIPPREEQERILAVIDTRRNLDERVVAATEKSIERLREFRAALITAAVTGQIDVATWGKQGQTDRRLEQIEEAMRA